MVGALSAAVDSHTCPCLCVDAIPTTTLSLSLGNKSLVGDLVSQRTLVGRKKPAVKLSSSSELSSSFSVKPIPCGSGVLSRSLRRSRKNNRRFVVVSELGGQYEDNFSDVKTVRDFIDIIVIIIIIYMYDKI